MISIIISTYNQGYYSAIVSNIKETIGLEYEIVPIHNKGLMGICAAYNQGAEKAKSDLLCFVHEDVEFVTMDWGKKVAALFETDSELSLAGVAGCKYKSTYVTGWSSGIYELDMMNITHRNQDKSLEKAAYNTGDGSYAPAVVLDGVCLFMRRTDWQTTRFDESVQGFHFYDLDISLRMSILKKKVAVIFCIDIIHNSNGKFNDSWLEAAFTYHKRAEKMALIQSLSQQAEFSKYNRAIRFFWIDRLRDEMISPLNRFRLYIINYKFHKEMLWLFLKQTKYKLSRLLKFATS